MGVFFAVVRKGLIFSLSLGVLALAAGAAPSLRAESGAADPARPNVVLIIADNQPARLLGAYGNREIATPNIDALARSGTLFRNAFAASGVCSPTRASLLTGLMPSQTGVHVALPGQPELDGWAAMTAVRRRMAPIDAAVIAVVDRIEWDPGSP